MIHNDTKELLKECNAGIKMGVSSIEEVLDNVKSADLKGILNRNMEEHQRLGSETHQLLNRYEEEGKEPNPVAKGMSWMKTNVMLSMKGQRSDGCRFDDRWVQYGSEILKSIP